MWPAKIRWTITFAGLLASSLSLSANAAAQRVLPGTNGSELRYLGDTIWHLRDTTVTRAVYHGDTVTRVRYMNDKMISSSTYVQAGDFGYAIQLLDVNGRTMPITGQTRVPLSILNTEHDMLVGAIPNPADIQREQRRNEMFPNQVRSFNPPVNPASVMTYAFSENLTIYQLGNSIQYVRGCAAAPPADTTTYLVFGTDSVRRVSPSPRTFGPPMVGAIFSDMSRALQMQQLSSPAAALQDGQAAHKAVCDRR